MQLIKNIKYIIQGYIRYIKDIITHTSTYKSRKR